MKFIRTHSQRHSKLGKSRPKLQKWRRPNGRDNKIRECCKGHPKKVKIGYKQSKIQIRLQIIHNMKELEQASKDQPMILAKIGAKNKIELIKKAKELNIKLNNVNEVKAKWN